ncbi:MAG TPA: hypothetical protein VLM38_17745 [Blastocatellia bacterium]|nr:hypothetical protein [Blastocatellia bacterium]
MLTAILFVSLLGRFSAAQTQDDWDWVNKHFSAVLEELMPVDARLGFSVGYRSYRDLHTSEPEFSFVFMRIPKEKYLAVIVRQPDGNSLYDQMMAAHRKNPAETIDNIKKELKLREQRFSEQTCRAVRTQYDEFYGLTLSMLSDQDRQAKGGLTATLHPRVHTFNADISGGGLRLVIDDEDHPFVRWANKTRKALEGCSPDGSSTK